MHQLIASWIKVSLLSALSFVIETFYHQIQYAFCLGIKQSPTELVSFRIGMRVQHGYSINFIEMEEGGKYIFTSFAPFHLWPNEVSVNGIAN